MAKLKPFAGLLIVMGILLALALPMVIVDTAEAQCGSSSSSCKNCHEVNAEHPVNTSGEWHITHAFGDFCAFCHAGNVQATEKDAAHQGMIYPLSDPRGSCQSCHPDDYMDQAKVYAVALGVDLSSAGSSGSTPGGSGGDGGSEDASIKPLEPIPAPGERSASGALIDYNRRYEIEVLGQLDTSQAGNLILWIAAIGLLLIGGALAWRFEELGDAFRKAAAVPDDNWRKLAASGAYSVTGPVLKDRPASVPAAHPQPATAPAPQVELPEGITKLDESTQTALKSLLTDPENGSAIIRALARLDPYLIESLQSLNKKDRDLLLAIVEQLGESES